MNPKNYTIKNILLISTFIAFYFLLKFRNIKGVESYVAIGIFAAVLSYCIFSEKLKLVFRIGLSVGIILLGILLPDFLNSEVALQNSFNESNDIEQKIKGSWVTNSAFGYSLTLSIKDDSANLSQSNLNTSKNFKWEINDDFLALANEQSDQYLSWRFELLENESILLLKSKDDSLVLKGER